MDRQKIISVQMRTLLFLLIDIASEMDTGGENFQIEMEISGSQVFFYPEEISDSKGSELATRRVQKLNEVLEEAGYPKVSGVILTVFGDGQIGFSLGMENEPDEEQKEIIASAFDGLND